MTKDSLWQGAAWLSIGSLVSKLMGALYRIFLPRVLGDYGVGLFQMAYPLYAVLLAVSVNGIPTALSKQTAEKLARGDWRGARALSSYAQLALGLIGLLLAVGMEWAAPWIARVLFSEPAATWSIRALAPALTFVALEASFRGYFQGYQHMAPTAVSQILEQLTRVAVMFPLAYRLLPQGVAEAAAGATLGAPVGAFAGMAYLAWERRGQGCYLGPRVPWRDLGRLIWTALPMSLSGLLFPLMLMADSMFVPQRLVLTGLTLKQATARFGQLSGEAMPLINLTMVVGAALAVSLVPAVARAVIARRMADAQRKVEAAVHVVWAVGMPMTGGLVILAKPLTGLLYGESGAAPALKVLAAGAAVLAVQQVLGSSLQGAGRGWLPVKNLLFGSALKFLMTWWLTPLPALGIRGAAMGTVAASLVTAALNWRDWTRVTEIRSNPLRGLVWPLAGTAAMALTVRVWLAANWLRPYPAALLAIPLGAAVYALVMGFAGEWRTVRTILRER
ncbi:MAG: polysaccharide biosynthesis protein [Thermaerobacter sp.]|nr:polysaccharide biosynthesis protein [Thermaerobacter sp.]